MGDPGEGGLTLFVDRNAGSKVVPGALRAAGVTVEVHKDHFPEQENAPEPDDSVWLREVGRRGWPVISRDRRIRRNTLELLAVVEARVSMFVYTGGNATGLQMAADLVGALPKIREFLEMHRPPFVATINRNGEIHLLYPPTAEHTGRPEPPETEPT